jgi:hypothetical protein
MSAIATKACFRCGETKPLTDFYVHSAMADGRFGKCKACTRADVRANRSARRAYYSAYDQERFRTPHRKALAAEYQRRRRKRSPEKSAARSAVGNALRDGRLQRKPCEACGATGRVQAHHNDYSKPLDVKWLCFRCHREHAHHQVVTVAALTPSKEI